MEKGLPGLGLREAGLKQADLQEDWLSWCVLREPCREGPRESWHDPAGCTPSGYLGVLSLMVGNTQLTWNLAPSTSKELSPLVCPGEAGWDLRDKRERLSQGPRYPHPQHSS